MTEAEWHDEVNASVVDLFTTNIHLDHKSIADFRFQLSRLDYLLFQGFRLLYKQRPAPKVGSLIDLTD